MSFPSALASSSYRAVLVCMKPAGWRVSAGLQLDLFCPFCPRSPAHATTTTPAPVARKQHFSHRALLLDMAWNALCYVYTTKDYIIYSNI